MTATNHALTGAVVGMSFGQPITVAVFAFASHFVLDVLPHYGAPNSNNRPRGKSFARIIRIDAMLLLGSFTVFLTGGFEAVGLMLLGAVMAMSPDIAWVYRFAVQESWGRKPARPMNWFNNLHASIQWGERPYGWVYEIAYFVGVSSLIYHISQ